MASMANLRALEESYKSKETLEAGPLPSRAPTRIWPGESRSEWRSWLICGSLLEKKDKSRRGDTTLGATNVSLTFGALGGNHIALLD